MAEQTPQVWNLESGCSQERHARTPPDSHISPPLTPPPTDERPLPVPNDSVVTQVLKFLAACANPHATNTTQSLTKFFLTPKQQLLLQEALKSPLREFVDDKVHSDYEPTTGCLTVRMPSAVHEFTGNFVAKRIDDQLSQIAQGENKAAEFAAKIANGGSARILLDGQISEGGTDSSDPVRREPDAQFQHQEAAYPGIVVEVSYSQDGKNLRRLASDYILRSDGDIKVVIGLDLNYDGKESTVSIWRPRYIQEHSEDILEVAEIIASQPFRSSDGLPVNSETRLSLYLREFATDAIALDHEPVVLSITCGQLYTDLTRAESMQRAREPDKGARSNRKTRKRKVLSSSPDRLRSEDEALYISHEKDAEARAAAEDRDFSGPTTKRRA